VTFAETTGISVERAVEIDYRETLSRRRRERGIADAGIGFEPDDR
jgi:hypothetical protein